MLELYVHIPFCIKKCNYCDFLSFPGKEDQMRVYMEKLRREIKDCADNMENKKEKIRSIFIGGGTPSILAPGQIEKLMDTLYHQFHISEDTEITIETNPGTLHTEKLKEYKRAGINRLSIGLQTTHDSLLKVLGRIHTYQEFYENYQAAREVGFKNINIDLMSGLPGQTIKLYEQTLRDVLLLAPEHISAYSLILEEGTPFFDEESIHEMLPKEEEDRQMYGMTKRILKEKGYHRYEFSNYGKSGKECRHNLGYWDDIPYLGFGLGASSYYEGARFKNTDRLADYLKNPWQPFSKREEYHILSQKEHREEFIFLGLRKTEGISEERFEKLFGKSIESYYGEILKKYEETGHLIREAGNIRFSDKGIDVSNYILAEFL